MQMHFPQNVLVCLNSSIKQVKHDTGCLKPGFDSVLVFCMMSENIKLRKPIERAT